MGVHWNVHAVPHLIVQCGGNASKSAKALAEADARASATVPVPVPVRVRRPLLSTELESAQSEERQQYIWSQQCQPWEAGMCRL